MKSSVIPVLCAVLMTGFFIAAYFTEHKGLYFASGLAIGFSIGATIAINRLYRIVKGRDMSAEEEDVALKEVFKL